MNGEKQYGDYFPSTERDELKRQLESITQASFDAIQVMAKENAGLRTENRLLREQIRVADVAFQHLHEQHQEVLKQV